MPLRVVLLQERWGIRKSPAVLSWSQDTERDELMGSQVNLSLKEALFPLSSSTIVLVDRPGPSWANLYTSPSSGTGMGTREGHRNEKQEEPNPWNRLLQSPNLIYHPL